ncbi:hypothetical protein M3Y99_01633400 [Aphelenchoides fujianensis]|nr:hypothetical protein M3Y99_01633400 [Aphelenchoides fujianensis]
MYLVWLLVALSPLAVHSKSIRWTFQLEEANYISVDVSIGTPPQAMSLLIATEEKIPDLWVGVPDAAGTFNPNTSTTFLETGDLIDPFIEGNVVCGVTATDSFRIGDDSRAVERKPFGVVTDDQWFMDFTGWLGVGFSVAGGAKTFIEAVVEELDEQALVITYDEMVLYLDEPIGSGVLILGDRAPDRCATDWAEVPTALFAWEEWNNSWAFGIDEVSFSSYTFDSPGTAVLSYSDEGLGMPESIFRAFAAAAGVYYDHGFDRVDCDVQLEISFTIGDQTITLKPEDYIRKKASDDCIFLASIADANQFELPTTFFKHSCVLLNYAQQTQGTAMETSHMSRVLLFNYPELQGRLITDFYSAIVSRTPLFSA